MTDRTIPEQFAKSAEAFCSLIEHHESLTKWDFIFTCADHLTALYKQGLALSRLDVQTDDSHYDGNRITSDQWNVLYKLLGDELGENDHYWEVFDPRENTEPLVGSVADDLADIYRDVKDGLVMFKRGNENAAICQWQESFLIHWGDHLVDAVRYLHRIITSRLMDERRTVSLADD